VSLQLHYFSSGVTMRSRRPVCQVNEYADAQGGPLATAMGRCLLQSGGN
jgi:hypothetical protein